ncbi:MAG: condensation domain-containing protein [Acutalibacteraceae bacterium]|nr:condensation domain-containing protein [Acutalibacteraceae bacterium]
MLLDHQLVEECLVYGEVNQIVAELYPNDGYARLNHIDDVAHKLEQIVNEVNSGLTSYKKIMKHIVRKNPFIKTGSNKIVRNQRAKSEDIAVVESNKLNMPISEMQVKLHKIISEVLGYNEFGIDTDLFSVGLDSYACIVILTELKDRLDFNVELNELISNCTIEKLERLYIKKNMTQKVDYSLRTIYPLTNLQKSMAYVLRGNTTTNIPFLYKIDSSVDLIRLKASIEKLFDIHPILKGIIQPYEDKGLAMFRNDDLKIDIPVYEMSEEEWLETKEELIKPYMYTPDEPLYHIGIYCVEGDNFLFFDIAHVISDGMTLGILLRNLDRLYRGVEIPKESYSFYEYMLDEQFRAENGLRTDSGLYFKRLMDGLKLDRSILNKKDNGDLTVEKNAAIHGAFKDLSYDRVVKYCHKNGVSKNILFLTAFNYCVSVFNDKDDVITSSVHNGRTDSRWGTLVGALFKVYNYRYTLNKYQTITDKRYDQNRFS